MKKFKVKVTLTEVSVAQYEIEAETLEQALDEANAKARHSHEEGRMREFSGPEVTYATEVRHG